MDPTNDVIDALAGIVPGDRLDRLRARRPEARTHAQGSYLALFEPADAAQMSRVERFAVALFVAALHDYEPGVAWYRDRLRAEPEGALILELVLTEAQRAAAPGPFGVFQGENAAESQPGPEYSVDGIDAVYALGERLVAGLEHAYLLTLHPRDADRARLQRLLDAGWGTTGIVTLSQLVAFLAFQLRVAHGLTVLGRRLAVSESGRPLVDTTTGTPDPLPATAAVALTAAVDESPALPGTSPTSPATATARSTR